MCTEWISTYINTITSVQRDSHYYFEQDTWVDPRTAQINLSINWNNSKTSWIST